jgi:hypothetical protein
MPQGLFWLRPELSRCAAGHASESDRVRRTAARLSQTTRTETPPDCYAAYQHRCGASRRRADHMVNLGLFSPNQEKGAQRS